MIGFLLKLLVTKDGIIYQDSRPSFVDTNNTSHRSEVEITEGNNLQRRVICQRDEETNQLQDR